MAERNEEDFVSFEKALRDLKLQSEELKRMVSEGEIRAFRDGPSMKFKREDVETLRDRGEPDFADALEDDTGMVTEELSEEETLLADEDLLEDEPETKPRRRAAAPVAATSRRSRVEVEEDETEPGWVTGVAILTALVCFYGFMVAFTIAAEQPPAGLLGIFAQN